jgi:fimbrial chaperone protein
LPRSTSSVPCGTASPRRRRTGIVCLALAVGALVVGQATPASAAAFSVDPTLIRLSPRTSSILLKVRNESDEVVRLQLSAFAWAQSVEGEMQLQPTDDVIFFPVLLTLEPGQQRTVRVGTSAAYGAVEKSYRLFLEELPPQPRKDEQGTAVHVLTKMGIPIFLQPQSVRAQAGIRDVGLIGGTLGFALENGGTVHFVPEVVRVVGLGSTGDTLIDRKLQSWYVLAGSARRFTLSLAAPECSRIRALAIEALVNGTAVKERLETPRGTCGP